MAGTTGRTWIIPPRGDGSLYMNDLIPVLSNLGVTLPNLFAATVAVTVSRSGGTLYVVVTTSATPPSAAQIKTGQNELGATPIRATNVVVSSIGVKTFAYTALPATPLFVYLIQSVSGIDSNIVSATFTVPSLIAPTAFGVTAGVSGANEDPIATLSWAAVPSATDYHVFRSTDNVTYSSVATPATPGYVDLGVAHSITYFWKVCARLSGVDGPFAAPASVKMLPGFTGPLSPAIFVDGTTSDYAFPVSEPNVVVTALDNTLPPQLTLPAVTPPVLRFTNTGAVETYGPTNFRFRVGVAAAPVATLSNQNAVGNTGVAVTVNVTTDQAVGTLYSTFTTSATKPTFTQIVAGQDNLGTAVPAGLALSQAVSSAGAKAFNHTGFSPGQVRYCHMVHMINGTPSNIVTLQVTMANLTTAQADWLARSTAADVIWAHDFKSVSEVNAFRWSGGLGNDPNDTRHPGLCVWDGTDGITAGCLNLISGAGLTAAPGWWRPFSPLLAGGNGLAANDMGAGTITPRLWNPNSAGQTEAWLNGYYGHPDLQTIPHASPGQFDGTAFYLQMRIKMDPTLTDPGFPNGGKLTFITTTKFSHSPHEIVTYARAALAGDFGPNYHRMYDGYNASPVEQLDSLGRPGQQVGSDLANYGAGHYCGVDGSGTYCWHYSGGWDTLLYHIVPGHDGVNDTLLQVWAANAGQTSYTKIWDLNYALHYNLEAGDPPQYQCGYNALICSAYHNEDVGPEYAYPHQVSKKWAQIILSKSFIPCPAV